MKSVASELMIKVELDTYTSWHSTTRSLDDVKSNSQDFIQEIQESEVYYTEVDTMFRIKQVKSHLWGLIDKGVFKKLTYRQLFQVAEAARACGVDVDKWKAFTALTALDLEFKDGAIPTIETFEELFVGRYDRLQDFLDEQAKDLFGNVDEKGMSDFFDWESFEGVVRKTYEIVIDKSGDCYVFNK